MLVSIIFFLTVTLETNYLRMYWTDLHQILGIGTYVGHGALDLFKRSQRWGPE